MQSNKKADESLQKIAQVVENLQHLGKKLMSVMDKQTDAITAGNDEEIEKHTETYTDLRGRFNEQEKQFVEQLQYLVSPADKTKKELRLEQVKEVFPDYASVINEWKRVLTRQSHKLKQKHERLVRLLDFALNRNTEVMQSIYRLNNKTNTHYSSGGRKEEVSSGMAVNKEV